MENKQDQVKQQLQEKKARLEQIRDAYHREQERLQQQTERQGSPADDKVNDNSLADAYQAYRAHQRQYA